LVLFAMTYEYIANPLVVKKTTTEKDASGKVTKTTVEEAEQQSDVIIVGAAGLGAILVLIALWNGRLKLTGPGGCGVEWVATTAVAKVADAALDAQRVAHGVRTAAAQEAPRGEAEGEPDAMKIADYHADQALARWNELRADIDRSGPGNPPFS
jgi:hypothetical protein